MKGYVWKEGMPSEEEAEGAYWERNMLALQYAKRVNELMKLSFNAMHLAVPVESRCGWYYDDENNWDGWHRVISLDGGEICFHIPDDFDIGNLPEIIPNWDGHTTKEKWDRVAAVNGCDPLEWKE